MCIILLGKGELKGGPQILLAPVLFDSEFYQKFRSKIVLTFDKHRKNTGAKREGAILLIFAQNREKSGFSNFIGHKHQNKRIRSANSY